MAADLKHPERVVGFHFFNPVAVMPLVEIVRAAQTDDATLATAFATGKALKKSCVLVKDAPAFVVNRLLTRFMGEVTKSVDEGTDFHVADNALAPLGLPMTPSRCCSWWALPWPTTCRGRCTRPTRIASSRRTWATSWTPARWRSGTGTPATRRWTPRWQPCSSRATTR